MIRAVCIGEPMVELRPAGEDGFTRAVAGDVYNTAVYLRRCLGGRGEVSLLTVLGEDPLSAGMTADVQRQGVDTRFVLTQPGRLPGLYMIELDARGDRTFHYWRSQSAARLWMARLAELGGVEALAGTDLVFLSGISLAILRPEDRRRALDMMAGLKGRIGRLAFDPNVRPALWTGADDARSSLETACGLADVVLASTSDAEWIWNEADPERQIDLIMNLGCPEVVITLGEHGVRLRWEGGGHGAPSLAGVVSDTSGAGDSFNAAYLAARGDGAAPETAAELGQKLAARVVAHHGALIAAEYSHPSLASVAGDPI